MHEPQQPPQGIGIASALFRASRLRYRYPDELEAIAGVDLTIASGDRIALVGQNGSGKTTLIKLLCGLLRPASGEISYKGSRLEGSHLETSRLEIGVLFQDPDDQLFGHTLLDDAAFGPRHQGLTREEAMREARRALERVSLSDLAYKPPHDLSFGQKKRAALAGLLAMRPKVLFLDEPSANLDPRQEEVFLDLLKGFDGTLVCISHDLVFLYELCDRAVVLDRGRIHHDYTMRELVSQKQFLREHGLDFSFRLVVGAPQTADESTPPSRTAQTAAPVTSRSGKPPQIVLRDYRFRYPDGTNALRGVDLSLSEGERVSLVGENGAGKTTLLSCLLGLNEGSGAFLFEGGPVTRRLRRTLWRRVGMVFQDCADQLFCPSVGEEIAFGLRQLGYSRDEIRNRTAAALSRVRLDGFEERVPLHLSGGERKRLALACVLAMKPRLLILDEPTAGLDPRGEELLSEILRDIDVTLLLVSHDMFFIREFTDRTLVMHQGRILLNMPTPEFVRDERLGNLNGLAFTYRERSTSEIRMLQHEHEHSHPHRHLHSHPHRHGDVEHSHLHEHAHQHPHRFIHSHPGDEDHHDHLPRRYHDHEHPGHEKDDHDHDHGMP
ncbi:MAG: energy-coupling factor transporter ATPase [Desulfobacterales bacterium]